MARLSSYYTLCPLIDQQSLLGVETDSNPGCAIVTLGKNIVIRYKLQDLKQVSSWSSKERLTTQVIFDELSDYYVAVVNGKYIRYWSEQETNLDNVRKHKFLSIIHTILKVKGIPPILVLQNGSTASLEWGLNHKKSWDTTGILLPDEKLSSCELISVRDKIYLGALVTLENSHNYILVSLNKENYIEDTDQVVRIELKRSSEKLVGHVILKDQNNAYLITLWSHGRMYSYPLTIPSADPVPGSLVSVLTAVNTKHPVVMVALTESTIAAYGADTNEEGAVLIIYNVQFKLAQAVQKLKLFTSDAKLWKIEDKLLLAANRHLGIAPYTLAPQRIEAMIGSSLHCRSENATSEDNDIQVIQQSIVADWDVSTTSRIDRKLPTKELKKDVANKILTCLNEGMSDAVIQEKLIPELVEKKDVVSILWCLNHLRDLPEELLIHLLKFCLKSLNDIPSQNGTEENSETEILKGKILEKLLSISYTDATIISYLRTGIQFSDILQLLNYLINNFNSEYSTGNCKYESNKQFCEWVKLLIDSHYQDYLISYDEQVEELLSKLREILRANIDCFEELETIRPVIDRVMSGKPIKCILNDVNRFYSVEEVKLY